MLDSYLFVKVLKERNSKWNRTRRDESILESLNSLRFPSLTRQHSGHRYKRFEHTVWRVRGLIHNLMSRYQMKSCIKTTRNTVQNHCYWLLVVTSLKLTRFTTKINKHWRYLNILRSAAPGQWFYLTPRVKPPVSDAL